MVASKATILHVLFSFTTSLSNSQPSLHPQVPLEQITLESAIEALVEWTIMSLFTSSKNGLKMSFSSMFTNSLKVRGRIDVKRVEKNERGSQFAFTKSWILPAPLLRAITTMAIRSWTWYWFSLFQPSSRAEMLHHSDKLITCEPQLDLWSLAC